VRVRRALVLALAVLAGCPDSSKTGPDAAPVDSSIPMTGRIQKKPHETKPVEPVKKEDPFPRERLIELYRADMRGDKSVQRKYGLIDADGKEVPAKQQEYEAALGRFSDEHADELSEIVNELDAASVTSTGPPDVPKK